jgi:hypothetical protein
MNEENTVSSTTLSAKLFEVQQKIGAVAKTSTNPHFRSKYADLNEVLGVVKPALNDARLVLNQVCGKDALGHFVETRIADLAGNYINSVNYLSGSEDNMQKLGAAITYARRYGLVSLLSLEQEDDDGETAIGRKVEATKIAPKTPNPTLTPRPAAPITTQPVDLRKLARQTLKVAVDKKVITLDEVVGLVKSHGKDNLDDLSDDAVKSVLETVKGKL